MVFLNLPGAVTLTKTIMDRKRKLSTTVIPKGNHFSWTAEPTQLFLNLWQKYTKEMRGTTTQARMFEVIASGMKKYQATSIEIKTKVDNMRKRFRREINKKLPKDDPNTWIYFKQVEEILTESKNFKVLLDESFDFSPLSDSDSSGDDEFWKNFGDEQPDTKTIKIESSHNDNSDEDSLAHLPNDMVETELGHLTKDDESIKTESDCPTSNTPLPTRKRKVEKLKSDQILAIEKAKLEIQKEKLKVMKNMADRLSFMHRGFLKIYKNQQINKRKRCD